ncbi:hypothetical protein PENTCL1PPCAC_7867, partial [Pristionchus entomophagus]
MVAAFRPREVETVIAAAAGSVVAGDSSFGDVAEGTLVRSAMTLFCYVFISSPMVISITRGRRFIIEATSWSL